MEPIGALISGIFGGIGQASANQANAGESHAQRVWQEAMSNSAIQRSARDAEAAGLNRIHALGSPASTPGGAMAVHQNVAGGLAASVRDTIQFNLQKEKQKEEIGLLQEQKEVAKATKLSTQASAAKSLAETAILENEQPASRVKGAIWQKIEDMQKSGAEKFEQNTQKQDKLIKDLKLQLFNKN